MVISLQAEYIGVRCKLEAYAFRNFTGHGQATSPIYTEANDFIENILMKRILIPWILTMTPAVICPAMARSYFKYFVQHSGPNSFQLPFPAT